MSVLHAFLHDNRGDKWAVDSPNETDASETPWNYIQNSLCVCVSACVMCNSTNVYIFLKTIYSFLQILKGSLLFSLLHRKCMFHSPKKTHRWPTGTWKDAQHPQLLEKCKSKLQWGTTSHRSKWPSLKNLQITNAGEGVEKREPSYTVDGM